MRPRVKLLAILGLPLWAVKNACCRGLLQTGNISTRRPGVPYQNLPSCSLEGAECKRVYTYAAVEQPPDPVPARTGEALTVAVEARALVTVGGALGGVCPLVVIPVDARGRQSGESGDNGDGLGLGSPSKRVVNRTFGWPWESGALHDEAAEYRVRQGAMVARYGKPSYHGHETAPVPPLGSLLFNIVMLVAVYRGHPRRGLRRLRRLRRRGRARRYAKRVAAKRRRQDGVTVKMPFAPWNAVFRVWSLDDTTSRLPHADLFNESGLKPNRKGDRYFLLSDTSARTSQETGLICACEYVVKDPNLESTVSPANAAASTTRADGAVGLHGTSAEAFEEEEFETASRTTTATPTLPVSIQTTAAQSQALNVSTATLSTSPSDEVLDSTCSAQEPKVDTGVIPAAASGSTEKTDSSIVGLHVTCPETANGTATAKAILPASVQASTDLGKSTSVTTTPSGELPEACPKSAEQGVTDDGTFPGVDNEEGAQDNGACSRLGGGEQGLARDGTSPGLGGGEKGVAGDGAFPGVAGGEERVNGGGGTLAGAGVNTVVVAVDGGEAGGGGDEGCTTGDREILEVKVTGAALPGEDCSSTGGMSSSPSPEKAPAPGTSPPPPPASTTLTAQSAATVDAMAVQGVGKVGMSDKGGLTKKPRVVKAVRSAKVIAANQASKDARKLKRDGKRQKSKDACGVLGLKATKGGAATNAGDGASESTQGLGTGPGSGQDTQDPTSPGRELSTEATIGATNNMARSGGGASSVTGGSASDIDTSKALGGNSSPASGDASPTSSSAAGVHSARGTEEACSKPAEQGVTDDGTFPGVDNEEGAEDNGACSRLGGGEQGFARDGASPGLGGGEEGVAGDGAFLGVAGGEERVTGGGTLAGAGVTTVVIADDAGRTDGGGDGDGITCGRDLPQAGSGQEGVAGDGTSPKVAGGEERVNGGGTLAGARVDTVVVAVHAGGAGGGGDESCATGDSEIPEVRVTGPALHGEDCSSTGGMSSSPSPEKAPAPGTSPSPPPASTTHTAKSAATVDATAVQDVGKVDMSQKGGLTKKPRKVKAVRSAEDIAANQASKDARKGKRDVKRKKKKDASEVLGLTTTKGGAATKAGDGASESTQGLDTGPCLGKDAQGPTSPGRESSTEATIGAANSMARSGTGASSVSSGSAPDIDPSKALGANSSPASGDVSFTSSSAAGVHSTRGTGEGRAAKQTEDADAPNSMARSGGGASSAASGSTSTICDSKALWENSSPASGDASSTSSGTTGVQSACGTGKDTFCWKPAGKKRKPTGLLNPQNQCATNAVVQLLRSNEVLWRALTGHGGERPQSKSFAASLGSLLKAMENNKKGVRPCFVQPKVIEKLNIPRNMQEDAGDVLLRLLDVLATDCTAFHNEAVKAALKGLKGTIRYRGMCLCGRSSVSSDNFELLQVPMGQPTSSGAEEESEGANEKGGAGGEGDGVVHLNDLLKKVFTTEMVDSCSECRKAGKKATPGGKSRTPLLANAPGQLMLRLGRYADGNLKLTNLVTIPTEINFGPFTEAGSAPGEPVLYDLEAVVHHLPSKKKTVMGQSSTDQSSTDTAAGQSDDLDKQGGHYVTCARTSHDTWRLYNDTNVSTVSTAEALCKDVYIVSYAKRR